MLQREYRRATAAVDTKPHLELIHRAGAWGIVIRAELVALCVAGLTRRSDEESGAVGRKRGFPVRG